MQAKQNVMLVLREHKKDLLSALSCAVELVTRDINVPMRPDASVLGTSLNRLESFFLNSFSNVVALPQTSEAINKNLKIIYPNKTRVTP